MSATLTLFRRWMTAKNFPSERQAALALGVHPTNVTFWKHGKEAGADVIERMALDLGEDPTKWAVQTMVTQTRGETSRAWERMARKLGAAAAVACAVVALPYVAAHADAVAATLTALPTMHYAKLTLAVALIATALWSGRGRATAPMLA